MAEPDPEKPRDRVEAIHQLDEAARIVTRAKRFLGELHGRMNDDEDMRWLVGMLAVHAKDGTMLPPRLTPLVAECAREYLRGGTGRFTVAVPVENVRAPQ